MNARNLDVARKLKQAMWPADSLRPVNWWAILDAAKDERVFDLVSRSYLDKCCLFAGDLFPQLERTAPHLMQLSSRDTVTNLLLTYCWGNAWGVFVKSDAPIRTLRRHLRTLLRVKDESGRYLLFRYYDPRVLRVYLPTCHSGELKTVFGSAIENFRMEARNPASIVSFEMDSESRLKPEVVRI